MKNKSQTQWEPIANYPAYEINKLGQIRSLRSKTKKNLKPVDNGLGYKRVSLTKDGEAVSYYIHRLVAQTFLPNPENKPEVNHLNGKKDDNRLENLEWSTKAENLKHAAENGFMSSGEDHYRNTLSDQQVRDIREMKAAGIMQKDIAALFNTTPMNVSYIVRGINRKNARLG
jgi:hypothetical protein